MNEFKNITEAWPIYDTIMIGNGSSTKPGWYENYRTFGADQVHPFFNVRNRGEVSLAYTNLETKDQMPYVYHLYSIGLNFIASPGKPEPQENELVPDDNHLIDVLWVQTLMDHCSVRLRVRQDEKLINNVVLTPEGTGHFGYQSGYNPTSVYGCSVASSPGQPHIANRFTFPEPIEIPRGSTFNVELHLSRWAQTLLQNIPGPGTYAFFHGITEHTAPKKSLIRCSLMGKRAVQQRGELHY